MNTTGLIQRVLSNFLLLTFVYLSLNWIEHFQERASLSLGVLVYASARMLSAFRSLHFLRQIERLEMQVFRTTEILRSFDPIRGKAPEPLGRDRNGREAKSYVDLMFLGFVFSICLVKIIDP
jgi:hypothetical protein